MPERAARRDHLPFSHARQGTPRIGEVCDSCGVVPEWVQEGTVEIGMFVVDLDERTLWSEGKRLPAVEFEDNWTEVITGGKLTVIVGPRPHHMPELFAHFPLENGAWALLHVHCEEPELTLMADSRLGLHVVWGIDDTPVAEPSCEGHWGNCDCLPILGKESRRGRVITAVVIDTADIVRTLSLWGALDIAGREDALERGRRVRQTWEDEHG